MTFCISGCDSDVGALSSFEVLLYRGVARDAFSAVRATPRSSLDSIGSGYICMRYDVELIPVFTELRLSRFRNIAPAVANSPRT